MEDLIERPARIEAAPLEDVNSAGREFFHPDGAQVIVVGDLSKIEEPVRQLELGPIHYLDREGNPIAAGDARESIAP
jgi:hypothetical protein